MEAAVEYAQSFCPQHNLSSLISSYFNTTTFPNPVQDLPRLFCARMDTQQWIIRLLDDVARIWLSCIILGLGLPSAVLALVTFSVKEFRNVSFFYHRYINALELIQSINHIVSMLYWYLDPITLQSLPFLLYGQVVGGRLIMGLKQASEWVTIWVSFERGTLCNSPEKFEKINKKWVARVAVVLATLLPTLTMVPFVFMSVIKWNPQKGRYESVLTELSKSPYFHTFSTVIGLLQTYSVAVLIVPASVITIIGLLQMSKRKRALISKAGSRFQSITNQNLSKQITINSQLCWLQICEALPLMLCQGLLAILRSTGVQTDMAILTRMPLEEAMWMVTGKLYVCGYLSFSYDSACAIAHSTHFFRYILFSVKVRKAAKRIFTRGKPVGTMPSEQ